MITTIKNLLYDPNSFANFLRAGIFVAGEVLSGVDPTSRFFWAGKTVQALALIIRAGDKNLPTGS